MDWLTLRSRHRASGASRNFSAGLRLLPVGLALGSIACFEQPVRERLDLRFLIRGDVVISALVRISAPEESQNRLVEERVESARRDLLEGNDAWSARFRAMSPLPRERMTWEKSKGRLDRSVHSARVEDEEALRRFFSDSLIDVSYSRREHRSELVMVPGKGSRATSPQRDRLKKSLDGWCSVLADYDAAMEALYRYLDSHPRRARACFGALFEGLLSKQAKADLETEAAEAPLVEKATEGMEKVLDLFSLPDDSAYSLEEISQLVYDPFPAPLTLHIPGTIEEIEGFVSQGKGELAVPELSLWNALRLLEGRWLTPDPVLAYYDQTEQSGGKPFDLDGFVARKRWASPPPTASEIRRALEKQLSAAPVYRVKWNTESLDPAADDALGWDDREPRD